MDWLKTFLQNDYYLFVPIVIGTVIVASFFDFALRGYVKKIAAKTKTNLDEAIIKIVKKPLLVLIIVIGLHLSLSTLPFLDSYESMLAKIFFVLAVFIVTFIFSRIFAVSIDYWLKVQKRFEKTPRLLSKIINITIYLLAILIVLTYFHVDVTPLVATMGLGSLGVGLALQNTFSDFFAGLHIISDRPINVGDFIEIDNISGYVKDIGWRSTRIRTLPNTYVIIPNSKLSQSTIINNSLPKLETVVFVECGVSYESDLEKVEKVTLDVARDVQKNVEGATRNHEPLIRYHTFGDSNIKFKVVLKVDKYANKFFVISEFIKALKQVYDKEGIEISWPVRKIYQARP